MAEGPGDVRHEHWIGGAPSACGRSLPTSDPATGLPGEEVAAGTAAAGGAAAKAQSTWAARPAADRSAVVHAIADAIEAHVARGLRVAERIDAGQVGVNGGALTIETPFGGFKQSGYGRETGIEALHDDAQTKTVSLSLN